MDRCKKDSEKCLILIADDLTGAMDTGVFLSDIYSKVSVLFDKDFISEESKQSDAIIIDTESRNIEPEKAYSVLKEYLLQIKDANSNIIYKKVDSTLRGNIGPELEAVLSQDDVDLLLFVPALPANGRTTLNGFHYLNGKLLTESDLASDPFSPISSAYIPEIIKEKSSIKVSKIEINEIRKGKEHILQIIDNIYKSGGKVVVADAETDDDLTLIVSAIDSTSYNVLPCGSAGLFSKIFEKAPKISAYNTNIQKSDKPVVVISGSPAQVSKLQIEQAERQGEYILRLDDEAITSEKKNAIAELKRAGILIKAALKEGRNVVIDAAGTGKRELGDKYKGKPEELKEASRKVQDSIKCILEEVIIDAEISGIMIFGGDTAINICKNLNTKALRILGEIEPLVPYGVFEGGNLNGVFVSTKAGGFGSDNIIGNAIDFFRDNKDY